MACAPRQNRCHSGCTPPPKRRHDTCQRPRHRQNFQGPSIAWSPASAIWTPEPKRWAEPACQRSSAAPVLHGDRPGRTGSTATGSKPRPPSWLAATPSLAANSVSVTNAGASIPGTNSAGTGTVPGARVPPPAATWSRRSTKAGAQTPATLAPLGQSHHARPRSTKAGAQTPATRFCKMHGHGNKLHAQQRPESKLRRQTPLVGVFQPKFSSLNEGRSASFRDTPRSWP